MGKAQPDLSIVIVSFNAWEFLDLTLYSVQKAMQGLSCEVIVVDNASSVDIVNKVQERYDFVKVITNAENLGFAKANNIGLKAAVGRLALLLNPDIIVGEDTLREVLRYYQENPFKGALGLRMLNGEGYFLKESKRGLPTPLTSLYKITGLCHLFPSSVRFAGYYHGNLDPKQDHHVDVLSGAFLVQPRDADGFFEFLDERYFMYGEDIDLSCQLKHKFGANHYLGSQTIIHFKGKSTPASAFIYRHFYQAMWLFYKKYFKTRTPVVLNALIWLAINLIQQFKIAMLYLKRPKNNQKLLVPSSIRVVSMNEDLKHKLERVYAGSVVEIALSVEDKLPAKELIVFDLATIDNRKIISILEKCGPGNYAYSSPSGSYMVENAYKNSKGRVVYYK